jgi:hypothetical protein
MRDGREPRASERGWFFEYLKTVEELILSKSRASKRG